MTATTQDRDTKRSDGVIKAMKMAAVKIPKGVLTCTNPLGFVDNAADAGGLTFAGVSYEKADNSAGPAGGMLIRIEKTGEHTFNYGGGNASQSLIGKEVYVVDNQTVDEDPLITTNDIKCGVIAEVVNASVVRIRIDGYAR